jgi:exosortase
MSGPREKNEARRARGLLPARCRKNGWTEGHFLLGLFMLAAGLFATRHAFEDILRIATTDEESSHILLVPVVCAWLAWVRRGRLRFVRPRGQWLGVGILVLGWFIHSYGDFHLIETFWYGGAVMVVVGSVLTVGGSDLLKQFLPVFAVLAFIVPVPGLIRWEIAGPLQVATAKATHYVLVILGIPADLHGNVININGVDVAIAEACNGLRMVFALVLVSFAFAFGLPLKAYVRFLILAASPISAIICNVIRLVPTVWVYGKFSIEVADTIHDITGWIMLPIAFLILLGIIKILRWAMIPVTQYTLAYEA